MILNSVKKYNKTIYICCNIKINIFKRFMFSRTRGLINPLYKNTTPHIFHRNYAPDLYSVIEISYDARTGSGKKLPNHELVHKLLRRNSDGKIIGEFTTDPKPSFQSELLDNQQYLNGKPVLNNEKGQHVTIFEKAKIVENNEHSKKPIYKKIDKYQDFVDKHEKTFDKIYENQKNGLNEVRVDKNDPRFYNENGTRDYDNFP